MKTPSVVAEERPGAARSVQEGVRCPVCGKGLQGRQKRGCAPAHRMKANRRAAKQQREELRLLAHALRSNVDALLERLGP